MNYEKVFEHVVNETQKYLENNHLHSMIIGISGGLDSTVTAAICHEVEKRNPNLKFYGVSLPCSSNTTDENNSAMLCMMAFCNKHHHWIENLQKEYLLMKATCSQDHDITRIGQGNIKARLRMIYLYDLAYHTKGLVIDTDNLTEHYLGFFTVHGDVGDFNPIGGLWKHEVYELAQYLKEKYRDEYYQMNDDINNQEEIQQKHYQLEAIQYVLNIRPTDGNGVGDYGDMGQIAPAFVNENNIDAYRMVDDIIKTYLHAITQFPDKRDKIIQDLRNKYAKYDEVDLEIAYHTVDDIIRRIQSTEYKRKGLPVVIDRKNILKIIK